MDFDKLTTEEIKEMQDLSNMINDGTATLRDYERYEQLLIKAGFTKERIRERMNEYGYDNYQEYLRDKHRAKTKEDKKILNVVIVSSLVAFCGVVIYFLISGKTKQTAA